jgi:hypothetical protein
MRTPEPDQRSPARCALDEQIAGEPKLRPLELPPGAMATTIEERQVRHRRPVAVAGLVENGLVRPLDPSVKLREHSRVIIVAAEET